MSDFKIGLVGAAGTGMSDGLLVFQDRYEKMFKERYVV